MELERMDAFFNRRLPAYEAHQLNCIEGARAFYRATAEALPQAPGCRLLDLGCGTGLELDAYFAMNPEAAVTGIDLASDLLRAMQEKFADKRLTVVHGSYFDVPFGENAYDAAVSVESLHHFPFNEKAALYKKLRAALVENGYFILTDYMVESDAEEAKNFSELARLKAEAGIRDNGFYHYDTPLSRAHEIEALQAGGFSRVTCLRIWGNTTMLKATR